MQIKEIMTVKVVTISENKSLLEARELMRKVGLRRLPVIDDIKRIVGIITDGDVGRSEPSDASTLSKYEANYLLSKLKIRDIMTRNVLTVKETDGVEIAAHLFYKNKIGALPVVDESNCLCGIVTDSDVFKVIVDILGYTTTSTRLTIDATDKVGVLADIANIFKKCGVNIMAIMTRQLADGQAEILIRADLTNAMNIVEEIREAGFVIKDISNLRSNN